jgi:hypothetical protein
MINGRFGGIRTQLKTEYIRQLGYIFLRDLEEKKLLHYGYRKRMIQILPCRCMDDYTECSIISDDLPN